MSAVATNRDDVDSMTFPFVARQGGTKATPPKDALAGSGDVRSNIRCNVVRANAALSVLVVVLVLLESGELRVSVTRQGLWFESKKDIRNSFGE